MATNSASELETNFYGKTDRARGHTRLVAGVRFWF